MNAGTGKEGVNGCAANSVLSITVKQKKYYDACQNK
jgi:hypothetical protein